MIGIRLVMLIICGDITLIHGGRLSIIVCAWVLLIRCLLPWTLRRVL